MGCWGTIKNKIFGKDQPHRVARIAIIIFSIIYFIGAALLLAFGIYISTSVKDYNYLPPVIASCGVLLLCVIPFGICGAFFDPEKPGKRFMCLKLYMAFTLFMGTLLIVIGIFFFFFAPSLSGKIVMRWDLFCPEIQVEGKTNEESLKSFVGFLTIGGIISLAVGVLILIVLFIIPCFFTMRDFIKQFIFAASQVGIIYGIAMIVISVYLLYTYIINPGKEHSSGDTTDRTLLILSKSKPLLYLMMIAGAVPVFVGVFGLVVSYCYRSKNLSSFVLIVFELAELVEVGLMVGVTVMFVSSFKENLQSDRSEFLGKVKAYVNTATFVINTFNNNKCVKISEKVNADPDEGESAQKNITYVVEGLAEWVATDETKQQLDEMIDARINTDFMMIGVAAATPAVLSVLLLVMVFVYIIRNCVVDGTIDEEDDDDDDEDDTDECSTASQSTRSGNSSQPSSFEMADPPSECDESESDNDDDAEATAAAARELEEKKQKEKEEKEKEEKEKAKAKGKSKEIEMKTTKKKKSAKQSDSSDDSSSSESSDRKAKRKKHTKRRK
ncbi:uncharacterized protein MONOS_1803 [Monocercomonoides exilis]|uniref:uncharacterized protein n=1 Tax=Monocercomonoides exilis TaxID=2049356 RepID=UPI00355ABE9C|nr:hypothetical protein MONOS_1803 [Monocercomonoides exilis]|eukprot:MONOS_1803.1-p1 / transcript=MONOS_1803.1 / gene=MONOS_1803 / organism=Monocercomonoides_exilis_PA203 / gene_product=unspecified product / transcript_product=unspecified product / location=Mono_scaffold00034:18094-20039(-) / protein_length=554 / sequence_SO=supercontig / SO=protein_coding / is_pseudo=false